LYAPVTDSGNILRVRLAYIIQAPHAQRADRSAREGDDRKDRAITGLNARNLAENGAELSAGQSFIAYRAERESGAGEAGEKVAEKIEVAEVRTKVVSHYITVSGSRSYLETRYSITG
jgi:hypothetical protein